MTARFQFELDVAPDRCEVAIGDGLLAELGARVARLVRPSTCVLVTDDNLAATTHVARAEESLRGAGLAPTTLVVPAGEPSKCVGEAERLWQGFAAARLDADGVVVALGGGVVGDLAGFCAATWMRGVALVQAPTSTTAMCDSAIGGKTGINLPAGKNLVGAFHQPRLVLADLDVLSTLPERELVAGLAEVVKCAQLRDRAALEWLHGAAAELLARSPSPTADAVRLAAEVKADHVKGDVRDRKGRRMLLNLGHTTAHAIEAETGYGAVLHGEAVAVGLVVAARIAQRRGLCGADLVELTSATLAALRLPTSLPAGLEPPRVVERSRHDKKRRGAVRRMVLPHGLGGAGVYDVNDAEFRAALDG